MPRARAEAILPGSIGNIALVARRALGFLTPGAAGTGPPHARRGLTPGGTDTGLLARQRTIHKRLSALQTVSTVVLQA